MRDLSFIILVQSPVSRQTFPSSTATLEFPRSSTSTPVLLPRSRFSERVTKSSSVEGLSNGKLPTCSVTPATPIEGLNPFDDDDVAPVPAPRRTKRRRKRTAPRPPGRVNPYFVVGFLIIEVLFSGRRR